MALDQKQQKVVAVAMIMALGTFVYWYLPYKSNASELAAKETQVATLDTLNADVKKLTTGNNLKLMKDTAIAYARDLAAMRKLVPSQNEVPALIENISSSARRAGLEISDLIPAGITPGTEFDVYKYQLKVTGPYHRVATFLTNIGSQERIVAPINVSIGKAVTSQSSERKPRRGEVFVTADFSIQTYVAKTAPPSLVTAPRAGGN